MTAFTDTIQDHAVHAAHESVREFGGDYWQAYRSHQREHKEEAFYAMLRFIRKCDPGARLVYDGSDMGGPIYHVEPGSKCESVATDDD